MRLLKKKLHILIVDDNEDSFIVITSMLLENGIDAQTYWSRCTEEVLNILVRYEINLIITDNILNNGQTGFDLLKNPEFIEHKIPTIFMSGYGDEYVAVRALKAGAYDYLVKNRFDSSRLIYAINETLTEYDYQVKKENHQVELIRLATTDELTGLYNRRHFLEKLDEEIARYLRYSTPLSVALIDVDHFKHINDEHGHDVGDYVLRELSSIIKKAVRNTDTVCRYGGEEFLIAFPHTNLRSTEHIMERLRHKIDKHFFYYDHTNIPVTVSIGISEAHVEIQTANTLLKLADKALYTAKKDGRNRVISYTYGVGI